jgi:ribosomal protein L37AE/L43A
MFKLISSKHIALYECENCGYRIYGHPKNAYNKLDKCPDCNEPVEKREACLGVSVCGSCEETCPAYNPKGGE